MSHDNDLHNDATSTMEYNDFDDVVTIVEFHRSVNRCRVA